MGRNRKVVNHRLEHWMEVAEEYAISKFKGADPDKLNILLNLLGDKGYPYYVVLGNLGDRDLIKSQIDMDLKDLTKAIDIIRTMAGVCKVRGWTSDDFGNAMGLLFEGSPIISEIFDAEFAPVNDPKATENRVELVKYVGQYLQDLHEGTDNHE